MKSAPFLAGFCAVLGAAALSARADDSAPANLKSTTPMQAPPPAIAPAAPTQQVDPTDFSASDDPEQIAERTMALHQQQQNTPNLDAYDKQLQQQVYDNDWMLRNYTALLKKQGMASTPETDPSLIPQPTDPNAANVYNDPLLPENQPKPEKSKRSQANSNADPSSQLTPSSSLSPLSLQPLLAPLNPGPKRTASHDAWGSTDSTLDNTSMDAADAFQPAPTPGLGNNSDSPGSMLDSPGMTAQQEGLTKFNDLNLQDQDPMPDVVNTERSPHVNRNNNFFVPTTPTNDVAEFFKKQAEGLAPPVAPTAARPPGVAAPLKPLPAVDAPMPFAKPPMNNLRHIADPFDILNR